MANMRLIGGIIAGVCAGITTAACSIYESKREKKRMKKTSEVLETCDDIMAEAAVTFNSDFDNLPASEQLEMLRSFIERTKDIDKKADELDPRDGYKVVKIKAAGVELRSKLRLIEGTILRNINITEGSGE